MDGEKEARNSPEPLVEALAGPFHRVSPKRNQTLMAFNHPQKPDRGKNHRARKKPMKLSKRALSQNTA